APTIVIGTTTALSATTKDANGTVLTGRAVTWSTSNAAVATVSVAGAVTGVSSGTATITATSEGKTGTATVTVVPVPVASVAVSPVSANVFIGATQTLTAVLKDAGGQTLSGRTVTWSSSAPAVATVSASGVVTGVAVGTAVITATSEGKSGTATIIVLAVPVGSVTVTPSPATVVAGQTLQLTATVKDQNGVVVTDRTVSWSTNNASLATVSPTGLVSATNPGNVVITATSEGKSGSTTVTITPAPVASVTVSPASASVVQGQTQGLTATLKDAAGNVLTGRTITWTTSAASVATVSSSGVVTGVAAGGATITATSEGKTGTSAITVTAAAVVPVATVTISPASISVAEGASTALTAVLKDANGNVLTGRVITWSSSDPNKATVSQTGVVTGVMHGGATITATSEGKRGTASVTVTR
ncbi:MAG TPA: Ig-like domain-containing protein, partial [Gemmatimonadaceae bacterium]